MYRLWLVIACSLLVSGGAGLTSVHAADFFGLGDLLGGNFESLAFQVSGDGSTVVGHSSSLESGQRKDAFRWTRTTGMVPLGDLPGGRHDGAGLGVSFNGSVIVGDSSGPNGEEAFRWTATTGMVGLGDLPSGQFGSQLQSVSADGSVAVGDGVSSLGLEAARWTAETGLVGLGDLPGGKYRSQALDVSADGTVVVGHGSRALDSSSEAFVWTAETGMVGLGDLPGGEQDSLATAVSPDGHVIVGQSQTGTSEQSSRGEAFRWTAETGMVGLGNVPNCYLSSATAASYDGSIIVGRSCGAFIWTEESGMRPLTSVLHDLGVDLAGWSPYEVRDISWDGRVLVGWGNNPMGYTEAWMAILRDPDPVIGDTNADGMVDLDDFNNVRNHFGEGEILGPPVPGEAFPFDGVVDLGDLNRVRNYFGTAFPVPEPTSIALVLICAGVALASHR